MSAAGKEAMEWVGLGVAAGNKAHEAFTRRHSCSDVPTSPRRVAGADAGKESSDDTMAARAKMLRAQAGATGYAVRAEVKPNKALAAGSEPSKLPVAGSSEPRSPTPHPRHGLFVDRDGQERQMPSSDRERDPKQVRARL